jgi:hypothetical protein
MNTNPLSHDDALTSEIKKMSDRELLEAIVAIGTMKLGIRRACYAKHGRLTSAVIVRFRPLNVRIQKINDEIFWRQKIESEGRYQERLQKREA